MFRCLDLLIQCLGVHYYSNIVCYYDYLLLLLLLLLSLLLLILFTDIYLDV